MTNQNLKFYKTILFSVILISLLIFIVQPVWAAETSPLWKGIESCRAKGNCTLDDFLILGVNIANIVMKWAGVALLALFIIGGIIWITSGGVPNRIALGKKIITNGLIGLLIIVFAFTAVRWIEKAFNLEEKYIVKEEVGRQDQGETAVCPETPTNEHPWKVGGPCEKAGHQAIEQIKAYQAKLNNLDCNCGYVDGLFGSQTAACTERFQDSNDLAVDGIVGEETYKCYKGDEAKPCQ